MTIRPTIYWIPALAGAALLSVLTYEAIILVPAIKLVAQSTQTLLECKGHGACLPAKILAITGSVSAASGAIAKAAPDITASVQKVAATSAAASGETVVLTQKAEAVVDNVNGLVGGLRSNLDELNAKTSPLWDDADRLIKSGDASMQDAGRTLKAMTTLVDSADLEIQEANPHVTATLAAIEKLATDPQFEEMVKHLDDATAHGESVVETVDIATLPLRKHINAFLMVLNKILQVVKVTIPLL